VCTPESAEPIPKLCLLSAESLGPLLPLPGAASTTAPARGVHGHLCAGRVSTTVAALFVVGAGAAAALVLAGRGAPSVRAQLSGSGPLLLDEDRWAASGSEMAAKVLAVAPAALARHSLPSLLPVSRSALDESIIGSKLVVEPLLANRSRSAEENRKWEIGDCVINALIAAEKLAQAAMTIESAVHACNPMDQNKAACAGDVLGIYATFSAVAAYLSGVASTCPVPVNVQAMCASDIADINYGIGTLGSALATINMTCEPGATEEREPIPEDRKSNAMGMCVINAAEAAAYIGHAVLSIRASVHNCAQVARDAREERDIRSTCSADISQVLQSFFLVMAYLSNAAALCGDTLIVGAACSNRVLSVLAGLSEIAAGASGAVGDCAKVPSMVVPFGNSNRDRGAR